MICNKCNGPMTEQSTFGVLSFVCIFCGNCYYPAFPKRSAPANTCNICGDEFKKNKNYKQLYCPSCKKFIGKNFKKLKFQMEAAYR